MDNSKIETSQRFRLRSSERQIILVLGDFFVSLTALVVALVIWAAGAEWLTFNDFIRLRVDRWFYFLPLAWILLLVELYDMHRVTNKRHILRGVTTAALVGLTLYLIVYFASENPLPRRGVAYFFVIASLFTLSWRFLYISLFTAPQFMRRVLLVGAGRGGKTILQVYNNIQPQPFSLIGIVDDDPQKIGTYIEDHFVMGECTAILELIEKEKIAEIVVAISGKMRGRTFQTLLDAQEMGVDLIRMPVLYEELVKRVPIKLLETDWLIRSFVDQARVSGFFELGKRMSDILGGLIGVLLLLILLPFIALAIIVDSGMPIFYSQVRLGRGGKPYKIIKFRTMRQDAEADGKPQWASENDERTTRVGRMLRKTHIDEIPQFINVLRGEMSLVGPRAERPELVNHFQEHVPFYRARLLAKPGITGWAQINFPYAATIEETIVKLEFDLYYIKHRSLWLDLLILLRTPATVLGMRGQ